MTTKQYVALKPLTYAHRAMVAGDLFDANPRYGDLLVSIRKARVADEAPPVRPPPRALAKKIALFGDDTPTDPVKTEEPEVDMAVLREEYQEAVGRRAFHGWSADELRQRITEAKADE